MVTRRALFKGVLGGVVAAALPRPGRRVRSQEPEIVIRGGTVVTEEGRSRRDVRIRGEKIVEVGGELEPGTGARVLPADGLLVLPGGIDPHTHLSPPWVDDLTSGSRAALAGGITTVGHMAYPEDGEGLLDVVGREGARIRREALADVFLHPVVRDPRPERIAELPALVRAGHTTVKVYTVVPGFDEAVGGFLDLLEAAGEAGILTLVHCEDRALVQHAVERLEARGEEGLDHFADSRPVAAEVAAVERALAMAEVAGAPIYVVHLSSARALASIRRARERGVRVFVETRPLYLHLTEDVYRGPDGPLYVGMPPIRGPEDRRALWDGVAGGGVDVVATDHAPWTRAQKMDTTRTVANPRAGVNNLQVMLPMLFSEGVRTGRLSLERFVAVTASEPARLMGLWPRKGTVRPGADADLVLWDPERTDTVPDDGGFSRAGFSVFAGREVTGWPAATLRRGRVVYRPGRILAEAGSGRLVRRRPRETSGS